MLLPCRIADALGPQGVLDAVLNTDHVIWFAPHPERPNVTLARLTHGEAFMILAPFKDVKLEIENASA